MASFSFTPLTAFGGADPSLEARQLIVKACSKSYRPLASPTFYPEIQGVSYRGEHKHTIDRALYELFLVRTHFWPTTIAKELQPLRDKQHAVLTGFAKQFPQLDALLNHIYPSPTLFSKIEDETSFQSFVGELGTAMTELEAALGLHDAQRAPLRGRAKYRQAPYEKN